MRKRFNILISFVIFIFSCNNDPVTEAESAQPIPQSVHTEEQQLPGMHNAEEQQPKENPYKNAAIEIKTFKDSLGWGYDIFIDKNQYVHQPHIPAVPGNRGFSKEEYAKKTGELVAYKIRNNIMPPSVTPQELDSLGVLK